MDAIQLLQEIWDSLKSGIGTIGAAIARWGYPDNADEIQVAPMTITRTGFAYQLPTMVVPRGMELVIESRFTNGGLIYVARNQSDAVNISQSKVLWANQSVSFRVKKTDSIYVSGTVLNDVVEVYVEAVRGL